MKYLTPIALLLASSTLLFAADSDWKVLFDGKDLSQFDQVGSAKWRVEDGVIIGGQDGDPKRSGLLTTKERFKDFEIELEVMIDEHGKYNSGVYLRNDTGTAGRTGYQVNIGRGAAGEYWAAFSSTRPGSPRATRRTRSENPTSGTACASSPAART